MTKNALNVLSNYPEFFLPRFSSYLDEVLGAEVVLCGEHTGVSLAIDELNAYSTAVRTSTSCHVRIGESQKWHQLIPGCHFFKHTQNIDFASVENQQAQLNRLFVSLIDSICTHYHQNWTWIQLGHRKRTSLIHIRDF